MESLSLLLCHLHEVQPRLRSFSDHVSLGSVIHTDAGILGKITEAGIFTIDVRMTAPIQIELSRDRSVCEAGDLLKLHIIIWSISFHCSCGDMSFDRITGFSSIEMCTLTLDTHVVYLYPGLSSSSRSMH